MSQKLVEEVLPLILSDLKRRGKWPPANRPYGKELQEEHVRKVTHIG
ncbi:hypothetical protein LOK74_17750 [Brevibacillus humidisoli]|nr:hypothetical protein [Brevibacillus humidisoli]UFJ39878.1 hypothetical protein LOK74_17750 [Brevibacillus humidisoli]